MLRCLVIASGIIGALAKLLPVWVLVPFLLTAVLALVSGAVLGIYSSGLTLISLGIRIPRPSAAAIDGVTRWQRFTKMTFPLIMPFFTINMVLSLKNSLGAFDQVMALTKGGPDSKTETVSYLIFQNGLGNGEYSYQMANAVTFFIVLAILAFVQLKFFSGKEKV